ncbi:MAG: methionyl-tRNA formyltransferase [Myxococcales bacterium]|nr:methionyl-tRNA formyltransferase [Myxococcales bacterium]
MSRLRIVFMGTPDFSVPSLKALIDGPDEVVAVVTNPDRPAGRGRRKPVPSPVKQVAVEANIPVLQPRSVKKPPFREELAALNADLAVVIAYGKILPQAVLDTPRLGCINVHASILPQLRGAAPINWAIVRGHAETGVTTMQMDAGMDTGDILLIDRIAIQEGETAGELHDRLAPLGAETLMKTLERLVAGTLTPQPQDDAAATYAPMLSKRDGALDWSATTAELVGRVHGFNSWPGTFTTVLEGEDERTRGIRFKVHRAKAVEGYTDSPEAPGVVLEADVEQGLIVRSGDGAVSLLECQLPGRRALTIDPWLHGFNLSRGDRLGAPES